MKRFEYETVPSETVSGFETVPSETVSNFETVPSETAETVSVLKIEFRKMTKHKFSQSEYISSSYIYHYGCTE